MFTQTHTLGLTQLVLVFVGLALMLALLYRSYEAPNTPARPSQFIPNEPVPPSQFIRNRVIGALQLLINRYG